MAENNSKLIVDIDSDYQEQLSPSELVKGKSALTNMILNLFTTTCRKGEFLGERPYEPTYGANLEEKLFEPLDPITALEIQDVLYESITTWLPELYVRRETIVVDPIYANDAYDVQIVCLYQGDPYDIEFTLSRKNN